MSRKTRAVVLLTVLMMVAVKRRQFYDAFLLRRCRCFAAILAVNGKTGIELFALVVVVVVLPRSAKLLGTKFRKGCHTASSYGIKTFRERASRIRDRQSELLISTEDLPRM